MAFPNERVAKANDFKNMSDILARCGRTINPHLEKELEPSRAGKSNKNGLNVRNFVDIANVRITIMGISNNTPADASI